MPRYAKKIVDYRLKDLPLLDSVGDLTRWLNVSGDELSWLCNQRRSDQENTPSASKHYVCHWVRKRSVGWRLIESPKPQLKQVQRKILDEILNLVPAHPLSCGFVKNKSIVDFVKPHFGRTTCLKLDIADFFTSITARRVYGLFRVVGYDRNISHRLAMLTTTETDQRLFNELHPHISTKPTSLAHKHEQRHLPQGAPSSPAIANLCAYRMDLRMAGLARHVGGVHYTRYADDMLFSGNPKFKRQAKRLQVVAGSIAIEEGFQLNFHKTRIMHQHQRQKAGGVVLNSHLNFDRRDFDRLKATLFNCIKHGPASQNVSGLGDFSQHLRGKIAWVQTINAKKAKKLWKLFEQIDFD